MRNDKGGLMTGSTNGVEAPVKTPISPDIEPFPDLDPDRVLNPDKLCPAQKTRVGRRVTRVLP